MVLAMSQDETKQEMKETKQEMKETKQKMEVMNGWTNSLPRKFKSILHCRCLVVAGVAAHEIRLAGSKVTLGSKVVPLACRGAEVVAQRAMRNAPCAAVLRSSPFWLCWDLRRRSRS
jgi:hypothetical protein